MRIAVAAALAAFVIYDAAIARAEPLGYAPWFGQHGPIFQQVMPDRENANVPGETKEMLARFRRQIVDYPTREVPGTIVIDTPRTRLYYVLGGGKAVSYGIGVGREDSPGPACSRSRASPNGPTGPARGDAATAALSAALHGRRPVQSAGRPRHVSRQHDLPHPRHQRARKPSARMSRADASAWSMRT